ACGMAAATILPLEAERLASRPLLWGAIAAGSWLLLIVSALRVSRKLPRIMPMAIGAFGILLVPNVVGFQHRYMFLPVAASSLALAALTKCTGRRLGTALEALILSTWTILAIGHWRAWWEAGQTSEALVHRLVKESAVTGLNEIVIANVPHRVRGASVA